MGYNIAICDDDNLMAQNIKNSMLHEFSNKGWQDVTIDYYEDGVRLLSSIEADNSYRVVLLDINMEPMDGFQIAEQIAKSNSKILIVFVTSHEETVYDSFDYMPFYFIRKSRYEISVKRVVNKIIDRENHEKKIIVKNKDGLVAIDTANIIYAVSQDHYITIFTTDDNYVIRKSMTELENELKNYFINRAHKKYLVNYRFVKKINSSTGEVLLVTGETIRLGRNYKDIFEKGLVLYYRTL